MSNRPLVAVATCAALLLGCSEDPPEVGFEGLPSPSASPTAEAEDDATQGEDDAVAAEVDPTVVPPVEEMTEEYVEAVVNTIEARAGEVYARVLAEPVNPVGALPDGTVTQLEALFAGDRLEANIEAVEALAEFEEARELALPAEAYTGVTYDVIQVSYAEPGCLIAVGRIDRSGTRREVTSDGVLSILSLVPAVDAAGENPTPWRIAESLPNRNADGEPNSDEFALTSTLADFEPVLEHTCEEGEASRVAP